MRGVDTDKAAYAAEAAAAAAAAAAVAAPPAGVHIKSNARKKKGALPTGDGEQGRERRPISASASAGVVAVPVRAPEGVHHEGYAIPISGRHSAASVGSRSGSGAGMRPPRSPLKQPKKACVPTLDDALDDVQVRFVLNLPEAELSSADRLFFQLEQAWWFYEDFIADAHKHLPHFKLKEFAKLMFEHCEALRPLTGKYNELFEHFRSWKGTIPTAGCILLNAAMTKVVLVKAWKGNSRGLPKGKINQGEPSIAAAVREVMEETGYNASAGANEKDFLTLYLNGQQTTMYIVTDVDEGFAFEPQVRKEISAVEWFPLDALPKGCYGVEPFLPRLHRWMAKTKGLRAPKSATAEARTQSLIRVRKGRATSPDRSSATAVGAATSQSQPCSPTSSSAPSCNAPPKKQGRKGGKGGGPGRDASAAASKSEAARACSAPNRRGGGHAKGYDAHNRDTFGGGQDQDGGGGCGGGGEGWDFEAMLAANERLTGRTFVYDGNPHEFGDTAQASRVTLSSATGAAVTAAGAAALAPGATAAAGLPSHAHRAHQQTRKEDQVGHLKQRGGGQQRSEGVSIGGGGGNGKQARGAGGGGGRKGEGDTRANGSSNARGSRSRGGGGGGGGGKEREGGTAAKAGGVVGRRVETSSRNSSSNNNSRGSVGGQEGDGRSGGGSGGGIAAAVEAVATSSAAACASGAGVLTSEAPAEGKGRPSQAASGLCTEGVGGGSGGGVPLWGGGPVGAPVAGGAGLFGNFKFDMPDIMSAVSQG